jgi:hypothetical protein
MITIFDLFIFVSSTFFDLYLPMLDFLISQTVQVHGETHNVGQSPPVLQF